MPETRLVYRLRQLDKEQRTTILDTIGMGESTWFRKLNDPGTFSLDEFSAIVSYLEKLDGEDYDAFHLLTTIDLVPEGAEKRA